MVRESLSRWERAVALFGRSPWSSAALLAYGALWIAVEASRGKWIGFDGFVTLALGEVALATLRGVKRQDLEKDE